MPTWEGWEEWVDHLGRTRRSVLGRTRWEEWVNPGIDLMVNVHPGHGESWHVNPARRHFGDGFNNGISIQESQPRRGDRRGDFLQSDSDTEIPDVNNPAFAEFLTSFRIGAPAVAAAPNTPTGTSSTWGNSSTHNSSLSPVSSADDSPDVTSQPSVGSNIAEFSSDSLMDEDDWPKHGPDSQSPVQYRCQHFDLLPMAGHQSLQYVQCSVESETYCGYCQAMALCDTHAYECRDKEAGATRINCVCWKCLIVRPWVNLDSLENYDSAVAVSGDEALIMTPQ